MNVHVPVLDGSDDVGLVGFAQLDLDFVPSVAICLLQQEIQPTSSRLDPFLVLQDDIAKANDGRIFGDSLLNPTLAQFRMASYRQLSQLLVLHLGLPCAVPSVLENAPNAPLSGRDASNASPPGPLKRNVGQLSDQSMN